MKRYIFFLFIASLFSTIGWSQTVSTDKNAVTHSSFRVATTVEADGSLSSKALINVQYFDGLGRPLSTVGYQQSPLQKDIISNSVSYDNFSRVIQQNNITPLSSSTGGFQAYSTVLSNAQSFYGDANPYTKVKTFDNSSLNRILEQYGAGASWQNNNKFVKTNYASAGTDVRLYKADASMNINLSGSYPANSLTKITNTDEQGNIVIEYKDRANKLIQKQVQDDTDYITTYYVYDDMDRLVAIIQPVAYSTNISITFGSTNWNEGVFFYIYDAHGNVTQKKIPSADWEYLVYDKWDRVVWSQDGLQRETGKWKFYKYDILNRLVMSGLKADARGLSALQTEASASTAGRYESRNATSPLYYSTTTSYPTTIASADVNIVNYFDSYTNWLPSTMNFIGSDFSSTYYGNTKGLQTGGASKNLETNVWMYNVTYFDTKGRTIQTFRHNVYGYIDRQEFLYNFDNGLAKQRTYWQKSDGSTFLENTLNIYDQAGRLTSVRHGFGSTSNDEVVQLNYDEVGRLIQKRIKATSQPANKYLKAKVLLYGALTNSTLMNAMTVAGIVPTSEPYTGLADRFIHTGGGGNEQTTMAVLSGNQGTSNAIVDWVFIELRSSSNPANILKTRSSLLQIDGDIVDVDGVSDVNLGTLPNSNYYVAIKHRNHLGAMTAEAVSFANTTTTVDFITRTPAQIYDLPGEGTNGIELQTTTSGYALWGGNANRDGAVIYQGPANDRAWVGSVVLTDPGNTEGSNNYIVYGYLTPDVNLDGKVIFQGPNNDLNLIFNSVYYYPLNTEHLNNYPIYEQLPLSSTAVISSATTTALQTIDYKYHIRGGLLGINLNAVNQPAPNNQEVDLFAYKLDYETAGRWDGNIGKQTWNKTSNQVRSYSFTYDNAKRLKSGTYSGVGAENYSLTNVNYDKNGNILNLVRNGNLGSSFGVMDNLTYTYTGNKLYKVEDAVSGDYTVDFVNRNAGTNDYDYYSDGSLKKDLNKEITQIDYDPFLKLPKQITLTNNRWIKITYAGDGRVLKRTYSTGEYWEYDGALVHKNGQPYQLATPEGRANYASGVWTYEYFIQDHLGNTRVSFKANGSTPQATDYTDYDPWGIELNGTGLNNPVENRFKYQSKESLSLFSLGGINDFGARYYDKTVGRWWGTDAMSEKYFALTSYNYVAGNPILYTDSDGRDISFIQASETTDKKTGITTVTYKINVKMSIMNSSSMRGNDFQKAVISFTNQLTRALSGVFNAGEKNKIVFQAGKIDVKTVNSMSEVKNSDHLMVIVDDVTGKSAKGGEAGGLAELGGKIAYVEYKNSSYLPFLNEVMIHEFGHNMGLVHNWESGYKEDDGSMNYMSYSNYKTQFVGVQLNQSYLKWELGQLNTGQNYDIAKDYISSGFTTQQMPLNYNVNKGSKIPKRLKN